MTQCLFMDPFLSTSHSVTPHFLLSFGCWLCLKTLGSVFSSIQVNLNHVAALHRASQQVHIQHTHT